MITKVTLQVTAKVAVLSAPKQLWFEGMWRWNFNITGHLMQGWPR